nr:DMT family transporter [Candidatus Sigynarchaeota archaeon]
MRDFWRSVIYLVLAGFFWAFPPALGKIAVAEVSPPFITTFRLLVATLIFLPFLFKKGNVERLKKLDKKTVAWLVLSGGVFFGPHYVFYFFSLQTTPAVHVSILLQTGYVFSAILCIKFLKEAWDRYTILGFALSIAGVVTIMLAYPEQGGTTTYTVEGILLGDVLILVSMLLWAMYSVINKKNLEKVGEVPSIVFNFLFGALTVLPLGLDGFAKLPTLDPVVILVLCLIALFGSALGYLFYNLGLKKVDGARANLILLTNPVFSVVISVVLVAGEPITLLFIVGSILVISSLYFVNKEKKKEPAKSIQDEALNAPSAKPENTA